MCNPPGTTCLLCAHMGLGSRTPGARVPEGGRRVRRPLQEELAHDRAQNRRSAGGAACPTPVGSAAMPPHLGAARPSVAGATTREASPCCPPAVPTAPGGRRCWGRCAGRGNARQGPLPARPGRSGRARAPAVPGVTANPEQRPRWECRGAPGGIDRRCHRRPSRQSVPQHSAVWHGSRCRRGHRGRCPCTSRSRGPAAQVAPGGRPLEGTRP
mmetsp:Transcript_48110/g.133683  ORF Transcript_48110/g.133683 Transcript_48110/m.133683 type:complete len:213 (-) Transcript_48110:1017-1655(-)